ncbi:hypothetical protein KFL_000590090 [Klebsormidium nitens]|uniref:Transcription elongation factor Eaf N-terminal domain-containing protein n=1 Tax=Klebsormidium nitens TaxID=105231 RepID=A0A1Y1HVW3_KLENI|nr:hypothetical protein KFL_000590090 [Klebsormidium nitens]|eukprot:GAQ80656.1 hypothetical protein KFL_000590090 [Klebsormidium nitens]
MTEKQEDVGPKVEPERWYPVTLGSTLAGSSGDRLYTMRYTFKPASVRSSTSGSLHISGDNEVTMEFHPPAAGKPNFVFQGKAEPCKELEAVLFFDGESFTIEKLARSIGSLRHIKQQSGGGMTSAGAERQGGAAVEAERIDSPVQERDGGGGAKSDGEQEERPEVGKKGPKQGGKGPTSQKHPPERPSGKRKPGATEAPGPKPSKAGKKAEKPPESSVRADPAPADVEHIEEEEVVEEIVEEIIYEEEEARPEAPPRPKASASTRVKSGLVESSSDSGHSSGSGSDDDSDDDDDDEDDDDDDGDDDGSSGSDDDS